LTAYSDGVGQGATFILEIPLDPEDVPRTGKKAPRDEKTLCAG
jgi:hypothetical protein